MFKALAASCIESEEVVVLFLISVTSITWDGLPIPAPSGFGLFYIGFFSPHFFFFNLLKKGT